MKEDPYSFEWKDLGNIELGRPNLGTATHVAVYRLMQYTMRSVLNNEFGGETASGLFYKAGYLAGKEFCKNLLDTKQEFYAFISQLQATLKKLNIGILRMEQSDLEKLNFTLVISEDLDCSGLPVTEETVCEYDEGFFSGIFTYYLGKEFTVREIDCWSTGDRVCRFNVTNKS
jgi:uncharacterized protein